MKNCPFPLLYFSRETRLLDLSIEKDFLPDHFLCYVFLKWIIKFETRCLVFDRRPIQIDFKSETLFVEVGLEDELVSI